MEPIAEARERAAADDFEHRRYEDAFAKYVALAKEGSNTAHIRVAWMYETGNGVAQDFEKAEEWYRTAAATGSPHARFYLGNMFRRRERYTAAVEWLRQSADMGFAPATYALGILYRHGAGVPQDSRKAFALFEEAAQHGHLFAKTTIARDMLAGRKGLRQVPRGLVLMVRALWEGAREGHRNPHSDRLLR